MTNNDTWASDLVDVIFEQSYMTLATVDGAAPWASPLVFAFDHELRIYWVSSPDALHSKNIAANPAAAVAIFASTQPQNAAQGVYIRGDANEVPVDDLLRATQIFYGWRYRTEETYKSKLRPAEAFMAGSPRRIYTLKPSEFFGLDPAGHPEHGRLLDHRVQIDLTDAFVERYSRECSHVPN